MHTVIHANEGVLSDIKFTSAATNDSFMLKPSALNKGDIMAMDRAYIDYAKTMGIPLEKIILPPNDVQNIFTAPAKFRK